MESPGNGGAHGAVQGRGSRSSEGHCGDGGTAGRLECAVGVIDTGDDVGVGSGTRVGKDLDGNKVGGLGDTVICTDGGPGGVGPVSVPVSGLGRI